MDQMFATQLPPERSTQGLWPQASSPLTRPSGERADSSNPTDAPRAPRRGRFTGQDPEMYRYLERAIRTSCPHWLRHKEDDISQKAALKLFRLLRSDDAPDHITGHYLYTIASSVLVDEMRRSRRLSEQTSPLQEDTELDYDQHTSGMHNPEQRVEQTRIGREIMDCMARMLRDRRIALSLKLQGYSYRESAKLLEWAEKKTENLVSRGRNDLRACLRKKGLRAHGSC